MIGGGVGEDASAGVRSYAKYSKTTRLYDIESDEWSLAPDMHTARTNSLACVMQKGRWLYVMFGFNNESLELVHVERLDAQAFL